VKGVILAAGYATRLYPRTLEQPKHLLEIGGRTILDRLLDQLPLAELEAIYVVTNGKFAPRFRAWAEGHRLPAAIEVIDDGTTSDEDRLGAIGDLDLVISTQSLNDDLLVAAGDSLFSEPLKGFVAFARERGSVATAVYDVGDVEAVKRLSAVEVDRDWRVVSLEEKPERPRSTLAGIALYVYPRAVFPLVRQYLEERNNPDQPGRLLEWLVPRTPVYAWPVPGLWLDIGTPVSLAEAEQVFGSRD
jgi:glucose-1-phosphate thymidylyltransferase